MAALAVGAAGCSLDLSSWRPGGGSSPEQKPAEAGPMLESALKTLGESPGVSVQGQLAESAKSEVNKASLTVTGSGATSGTLDVGGDEAEVMQADGDLFVNAPDAYWLGADITNPDSKDYADNWVRVTGDQLGVDPAETLAPEKLSGILEDMAPDKGTAKPEKLDGADAYRIDLAGGEKNRAWVSKDTPHKLLRVEIEELAPEDGDTGPRARLDFSEPGSGDVEGVYDDLTKAIEDDMKGARDARIPINWDGDLSLKCKTGGKCTVKGKIKDDSSGNSEAEGEVRVKMSATLKNSDLGDKKCDDTGSLKAGKSVTLTCVADYDLSPSSSPKKYNVSGDARPSTLGPSDKARKSIVKALKKERAETLDGADQGSGSSETPKSPSGN